MLKKKVMKNVYGQMIGVSSFRLYYLKNQPLKI